MTVSALVEWADQDGPSRLLAAFRARYERLGNFGAGAIRVTFSIEERREVGELLGLRWVDSGRAATVVAVERALSDRGSSLADILGRTGEPPRHKRAESKATKAEAKAERDRAVATLTHVGISSDEAAAILRRRRTSTEQDDLQSFATAVATTWEHLPGADVGEPIRLGVLANSILGDPHALDRSTELGRTVARLAARQLLGDQADVTTAASWREAWASVGIACDEVSSVVLVAGLLLCGDAAAARLTDASRGEPLWLTLRSLAGKWEPAVPGGDVWVCENPVVVEAAASALGSRCPPLICTFGRPSTAAITLLTGIARSGVRIHVRADDDPTGQSIVAQLRRILPTADTWRYSQRAANEVRPHAFEEDLIEELLHDLRTAASAADERPGTT